jgi:hypothetical protein
MHIVDDLDSVGSRFYRAAIKLLTESQIPFLVGGAYAYGFHTGVVRRTKDFDIFMIEADVKPALQLLSHAGYQTEIAFPHWIAKAFCGDEFIDIIFSSGNGVCPVDDAWFEHALDGQVLGMNVKLSPVEEMIWQKSFILERDRCDVADVAHLLRHCGQQLDWQRLLQRFADNWRVLLAQIVLFDFIYPAYRDQIPPAVRQQLATRSYADLEAIQTENRCYGTYLSATQYLHDIDLEKFRDARLQPIGTMTPVEVAIWTANFMKPK